MSNNNLPLNLLEEMRQSNKELRVGNQRFLVEQVNITESGLRNILLTLATFLFTFTSPIFTDIQNVGNAKFGLIASWLLLFASICCGLIQFFIDMRFFHFSSLHSLY